MLSPLPSPTPGITGKKTLYKVTGGKVQLFPHEGQLKALRSDARFIFVIAGTQGGKTSFGPWWLQREIMRCGPGDYLAVTSSYDLFKVKMLPEIRAVFEDVLKIGRYWAGDKIIELKDPVTGKFWATTSADKMWGRIILRSASAEGGLESATAKAAWLDEVGQDDFSVDAWQAVLRRVSLNQGRILGTTTPYNLGWLKQLIFDRWQRGDPVIDVIQFASTANPLFSPDEMEEARKSMPEWKYRMFYLGQFDRPAGMIYDCYLDKDISLGGNLVKPFVIPPAWPRLIGIDPGAANLAKIWLAHDPDKDVYYAYREEHGVRRSTPDHVRAVLDLADREHERITAWYVGAKSESQQRLDYRAAGAFPCYEPPVPDVEAGIDRVYRLFKTKRLFVIDSLLGLRDQLGTYSREIGSDGLITEKIKNKETYHFLDALRYVGAGAESQGVGFA